MKINTNTAADKVPFKGFYEATRTVQENTLLNRGIIDMCGCALPQAVMSNNKDEAIERLTMSGIYFCISALTPFIMLPFFNKRFLSSSGIVKDLKGAEKNIIKVSKKYLTGDSKLLVDGIRETAVKLDSGAHNKNRQAFEKILSRYKGKEDELREKLIKVHKNVFTADFLTTALMNCATPYITTELTEKRTHKKGFSAAFDMVDQQNFDEKKYEAAKKKKMFASALVATVTPLIAPKLIMKHITAPKGALKKYAENFNYYQGMFMSKTMYALMWALCDYPSLIIGSRDKLERKDRAIRGAALFTMFFGGDFLINNTTGRLIDKFAGTKIIDRKPSSQNLKRKERLKQFFKDFKCLPRNFSDMDLIDASPKVINKTKKYGLGLYWFSLLANCGLIGFALPAVLNRMLRKSIKKDSIQKSPSIDTNQ